MEPFADLFWLSALHVRTYIGLRRIAGNLFLYVLLYNTILLNKLKFNTFFKKLLKNNSLTVQIFFIFQNYPTFHSEERLANLVRGRECFVGLSMFMTCEHGGEEGGVCVGVEPVGQDRPVLSHPLHPPAGHTATNHTLQQGCGSGSAWIRFHFHSWIRIQERKYSK